MTQGFSLAKPAHPGQTHPTAGNPDILRGRHKRTPPRCRLVAFTCLISLFVNPVQAKSQLLTNLEAGKPQTVVAYGTSLTQAGAWVKQLGQALSEKYPGQITIINSGGSGQWSKWGVGHLDEKVIGKKPDTVFIEFAINDSVARFNGSPEIAKANLLNMIDRIREALPDCEIILMTMTPGNKHPEGHRSYRKDIAIYHEMYRSVAKEKGLLLIDHYRSWIELQKADPELFENYVPDTIHPTGGYARAISLVNGKIYVVGSSAGRIVEITDWDTPTFKIYNSHDPSGGSGPAGSWERTGLVINDAEYFDGHWYVTSYFTESYATGTDFNENKFIRFETFDDFETGNWEDLSDLVPSGMNPYFLTADNGSLYLAIFNHESPGDGDAILRLTPVENDFNSWISDPAFSLDPAEQGLALDPDGDRLSNGLEAWFGS